MTTKNIRYQVTVSPSTAEILGIISRKQKASFSKIMADLIEEALEIREDIYFSKMANESMENSKGMPTYTAEQVFRECNLL